MNKVYYVVIKGRTLESRDLKELLARAVARKRNLDSKSQARSQFQGLSPILRSNPCKFADSFL